MGDYRDDDFDPRTMCCGCKGGVAPLVIKPQLAREQCSSWLTDPTTGVAVISGGGSEGVGAFWGEWEGCGGGCVPAFVDLPPTWDGERVPEPEPDPVPFPEPEPEPEPGQY